MNILFVCRGNVSRSFLAEMLLRNEVERIEMKGVSVSSAGLHAHPGSPPDSKMVEYLLGMGVPVVAHEARVMIEEDVDWADLLLVMEREQVDTIHRLWPGAKGKVELLGKYLCAGGDGDDIIDPFGRSPYHYRAAQSQITLAVKSLGKKLASKDAFGHQRSTHNQA